MSYDAPPPPPPRLRPQSPYGAVPQGTNSKADLGAGPRHPRHPVLRARRRHRRADPAAAPRRARSPRPASGGAGMAKAGVILGVIAIVLMVLGGVCCSRPAWSTSTARSAPADPGRQGASQPPTRQVARDREDRDSHQRDLPPQHRARHGRGSGRSVTAPAPGASRRATARRPPGSPARAAGCSRRRRRRRALVRSLTAAQAAAARAVRPGQRADRAEAPAALDVRVADVQRERQPRRRRRPPRAARPAGAPARTRAGRRTRARGQ